MGAASAQRDGESDGSTHRDRWEQGALRGMENLMGALIETEMGAGSAQRDGESDGSWERPEGWRILWEHSEGHIWRRERLEGWII